MMDIDGDGIVSIDDIQTFMSRHKYIGSSEVQEEWGARNPLETQASLRHKTLYPQQALSEKQMEEVLRELRQTLHLKRVSFYDMFNQLDQNKDGFITIEEFDKIDKWVKFEQSVKDGLFAFIDKGKIGMIDYATFL